MLATDELLAYRESVRTHLARTADADAWDLAGGIPDDVLRAAAELGFLATGVPEAHGGMGVDDVGFAAVVIEEAMTAGLPSLGLVLAAHGDVPVRALLAADACHDWLGAIATADLRAATALQTRVRLLADGTLAGVAPAIVGGAQAGLLILAASGPDGPVVVAVETGAAGVDVAPIDAPVGLRAAGLADVTFTAARGVPLHGADLDDLLIGERVLLAQAAVAAARTALALTTAYVRDRRAFGTPIAEFQNTRHALGAAAAKLRAAETLAESCLQARRRGTLSVVDAAAAKLVATEAQREVVDVGVQMHGGYGYMLEYPIAHHFADGRFLRLHGTPSQELCDEIGSSVIGG